VHTGQNWDYTLNQVFFDDLGLRTPDHYLDSVGEHLGATSQYYCKIVSGDASGAAGSTVDLGDTNSALAAYSAKRLKIPIFHMEAGNRCFDQMSLKKSTADR